MKALQFMPAMVRRSPPSGLDMVTTLAHFALVTYLVEPQALRPHVPKRFELDCIEAADGSTKALISVVPFVDRDFRFVRFPWLTWRFGQTNYRVYVTDSRTGEHVVWFFGTLLDSITVNIPRHLWLLPWHRGHIDFETQFDEMGLRYRKYRMAARSRWAPARLDLEDSGGPPRNLPGFPDLETGLVLLTHPLRGYYFRRDGRIGSYAVWHNRLQMTAGRAIRAEFPLLERLGLVQIGDLTAVHSVLIQPRTEFTIYLPPAVEKS